QAEDPPHLAIAKRVYILLSCLAFCNEIIAVFAASLGIARLIGNEHNPYARSALVMMLRECRLYFLAVRAHFLTGLLCFACALSIRMWATYYDGCVLMARAMTCLLAGAALFMLALFNHSLIHFHSFGEMWVQYIRELFRVFSNGVIGPIAVGAFLLFTVAAFDIVTVCFALSRAVLASTLQT
ncbi:hypothetical protein T484DRAFT_1925697, partial [Baffinella frigidus]